MENKNIRTIPYKPLSNTDEERFMMNFCYRCYRHYTNCGIYKRMISLNVDDNGYPNEIIYYEDKAGNWKVTCTRFKDKAFYHPLVKRLKHTSYRGKWRG